ncbi:MAG: methyltransferase domain-containing protein [Vicinamibacteraceae bacterium]
MAQSTTVARSLIVALLLPAAASAQGSGSLATPRIFDALALRSGATVCEIGAGDGELSLAASDRVGGQGHVYTSELGEERVKALQAKVAAASRAHIQVVAGATDRTNFPDGACDALFMRNVYHHIRAPGPMSASLSAALKPGGRLAVVDFTPPGAEASTPAERASDGTHGVTPDSVRRELADAGLLLERTEAGSGRWFMVVATKPGT